MLGLFTQWDCSIEECQLLQGDVLALYTDGVTESFNGAGDEFGEEGLLESLKRHAELGPAEMVQAILTEVQSFGSPDQQDDITLLIAKCRAPWR